MSAIQLPYSCGSVTDWPREMRCFLTASAWSRNHLTWSSGLSGKPAYGPEFQVLTRIWKKPTESRSPKWRFLTPDSTSEAITGSSGGRPRFCASAPIQAAIWAWEALSPGYVAGPPPGGVRGGGGVAAGVGGGPAGERRGRGGGAGRGRRGDCGGRGDRRRGLGLDGLQEHLRVLAARAGLRRDRLGVECPQEHLR